MSNGRSLFFPPLKPMSEVSSLAGTTLERRHRHLGDWRSPPAPKDWSGLDWDIQQTSEAFGLEHDPEKPGTEKHYANEVVKFYEELGGKDLGSSFTFKLDDPSSMALNAIGSSYRPFI